MRYITVVTMSFLFLTGCGIFNPRTDFELPATKTDEDPFSFKTLLDGTSEDFSKLDLHELFGADFTYINVRLADDQYQKEEVITHLNWRNNNYPDFEVIWTNNDGFIREADNRITLKEVSYEIVKRGQTDSILFSGRSQFEIERSTDNIWRIVEWIDEPTSESFFSPAL